jgi:hypothetical protein
MAPVYIPALRPTGDADTDKVDGAVPDAGERLSHDTLELALQSSVPAPPLVIWIDCDAGDAPPAVALNARLAGAAAMVAVGETRKMVMESDPAIASTDSVARPVRPAGSTAVIEALVQEVTERAWLVVEPAGVTVT